MQTAGVIGVGAMGSVIVERFVAAGMTPLVFDVTPAAVDRAVELGGRGASSVEQLARDADIVSVMVRTDQEMLDVVLGAGGVLSGLAAGKRLLLHSTIHPRTTRTIAKAAREQGVEVADACIAGIPAVFRAGQSACLVGADPALFAELRPHLAHLGEVIHMGPVGCGNIAKIIHNTINGTSNLIVAESLQLADAAGIPREQILHMMGREPAMVARGLENFEEAHMRGAARNLFDTIMPVAMQLLDEYALATPATRMFSEIGSR